MGFILVLLAFLEMGIGLWFIFRYERTPAVRFFGLFAIGSALYVGSNGFGYVGNVFDNDWLERTGWVGGVIATAFFLPFSYSFPFPRMRLSGLIPLLIWPLFVFINGILFSDAFVAYRTTINFGIGYKTAVGELFWILVAYLFIYWALSIFNLIKSYHAAEGVHRWQLKTIIIGVALSLIASIAFDVIKPLFVESGSTGFIGSLMTAAWVIGTGYIIQTGK